MSLTSTIKYGDMVIVNAFPESSDSISISHNGVVIDVVNKGEIKTLNTKGKICPADIVIGSKTLATKDRELNAYIRVFTE